MKKKDFLLLNETTLSEVDGSVLVFEHIATKAQVLKVQNSDSNQAFAIGFRTPASDSTGIAHILEHSVLAGSRKYPLRDPFFELVKGSLNTFLNAHTCPDVTIYPCASQNAQDFLNLMDVYLDAVFFPKLSFETYQREGWHYKVTSSGPVKFGGIVFNEMKGASSGPGYHFHNAKGAATFPDTHYAHEWGGTPASIPDLTYEALITFHAKNYHPTNSCIFLYGAGSLERELDLLADYLGRFELGLKQDLNIKTTETMSNSTFKRSYPVAPDTDPKGKYWWSKSWVVGKSADPELRVLGELITTTLCGIEGSPLKKTVLDSRLAESVSADLSPYSILATISCDVVGTSEEHLAKLSQLVEKTLLEAELSAELVEAAFKSLLFHYRNSSNAADRGIRLSSYLMLPWLYGADPIAFLNYERLFESLQAKLPSISSSVKELLSDNQLASEVILVPDSTIDETLVQQEGERLQKFEDSLSPERREHLTATTRRLEMLSGTQDTANVLALLPRLDKKDLPTTPQLVPSRLTAERIILHEEASHGVTYLHLAFDLSRLSRELLPYAGALAQLLFNTGTTKRSYEDFAVDVAKFTGGLSASIMVSSTAAGKTAMYLMVRGSSLTSELPHLFRLLEEGLLFPRLDNNERNMQLIKELKQSLEHSIIPSGSAFALRRASAALHPASAAEEQLCGLEQFEFIRGIADTNREITNELRDLCSKLFVSSGSASSISADSDALKVAEPAIRAFLEKLPKGGTPELPEFDLMTSSGEGFILPGGVYYVGLAVPLEKSKLPSMAATSVAAQTIWGDYLLPEIRYQGGAYGSRASFEHYPGIFKFHSYRDPQLEKTVQIFKAAPDFVEKAHITEASLLRDIIGVVSAEERPLSVSDKGYRSLLDLLLGRTDKERLNRRTDLLNTTVSQVRECAVCLADGLSKASLVVLGSVVGLERCDQLIKRVRKLL